MRTPQSPARSAASDDEQRAAAWTVLRAAAAASRELGAAAEPQGKRAGEHLNELNEHRAPAESVLAVDGAGVRSVSVRDRAAAWLLRDAAGRWSVGPAAPAAAQPLLDLYAPICAASSRRPLAIAHLGQSLDGYIATGSGDSYYVTGPANVAHLHRLRALCDAVLVGAGTVACDDPRLTVRRVPGASPVRVVLDPQRRLGAKHRVFAGDAPTLLFCADDARGAPTHGCAEVVALPLVAGRLVLVAVLAALRARGLHAVFVEGGGATVSGFLEANLLDRVQIAIAPLVTGTGRRGLSLPARDKIAECLRPRHRVFAMGGDVLFDCDLRGAASSPGSSAAHDEVSRVF
jgi:riboflavin-specific deaminase-like protein